MQESILDEELLQELPQQVIYPNLWRRLKAFGIDVFIAYPVVFISSLILGEGIIFTFVALLFFPVYKILMEGVWGYTIGKAVAGFRVANLNNGFGKITFGQAFGRSSLLLMQLLFYYLVIVQFDARDIEQSGQLGNSYQDSLLFLILFFIVNTCHGLSYLYFFISKRSQTWMDKMMQVVCIKD